MWGKQLIKEPSLDIFMLSVIIIRIPSQYPVFAEDGKLQEGLIEDLDYCLVPESAWKKFSIWYKDSTVITRISR